MTVRSSAVGAVVLVVVVVDDDDDVVVVGDVVGLVVALVEVVLPETSSEVGLLEHAARPKPAAIITAINTRGRVMGS